MSIYLSLVNYVTRNVSTILLNLSGYWYIKPYPPPLICTNHAPGIFCASIRELAGPVPYLKPGQTVAGAVEILGDWVILTTNGIPANVPMSVVAISQANSSKITKIDPMPLKNSI